ncbi:MAG TPA: rRNA maturation RNase YbeY, partial [Elusimicrobia bacterium]|nr:rRNA maturation RNase YbeY [Elusimicrobiota bacterium]
HQKTSLPTRQGQFHFTIIFIEDEKIRDLNQRYRQVNLATDVLVFPYSPSESEIYISAERAYAQAKEYRQTHQEEILRLIIHGVLHSLGWRDENPKERKKMWAMQEKILKGFLSTLNRQTPL